MSLLTPAEVCGELNIGKSTFYRAVAARKISVIKFGRSTRIDRADLERWVAELRAGEGRANA